MKTQKEIESLKASWLRDPIWDIETTEGFEEHYDELFQFHNEWRSVWNQRRIDREKKERQVLPHDPAQHLLSIRALFSAMAMQGFMSKPLNLQANYHGSLAEEAVKCADALISELNK